MKRRQSPPDTPLAKQENGHLRTMGVAEAHWRPTSDRDAEWRSQEIVRPGTNATIMVLGKKPLWKNEVIGCA